MEYAHERQERQYGNMFRRCEERVQWLLGYVQRSFTTFQKESLLKLTSFADSYLPQSPGNIEDVNGKVFGQHHGLWKYTVGEGARLSGLPEKLFVAKKDPERNAVIVVPKRYVLVSLLNRTRTI